MLLMLAGALLLAGDTTAPADPAPQTATAPAPKKVKERRVCRNMDDSSTRMGRIVCKTESEWVNAGGRSSGGASLNGSDVGKAGN